MLKIIPVASESLGVRSMATYVETDQKIFIDPGISVVPLRYGKHPAEIEKKQEKFLWNLIKKYLKKSNIVIITHYHYDHHNPDEVDVLSDKILLIKDPENNINFSQKKRGEYFLTKIQNITKNISIADSRKFKFGNTTIEFSSPMPHGENTQRGYVIQVLIKYKEKKFLFTSDVQGPALQEHKNFIEDKKPDVLYLDGPATYLTDIYYSTKDIEKYLKNISEIVKINELKSLIIDHHFMRDKNYKKYIKLIDNKKVFSASEFIGLDQPLNLEAERKTLDQKNMQERISKFKTKVKEYLEKY